MPNKHFSLILFLFLAPSCGSVESSKDLREDALTMMAEARSTWAASETKSYDFDFSDFCYCGFRTSYDFRAHVVFEELISVTHIESNEPQQLDAWRWYTINDLFLYIEESLSREEAPTAFDLDYDGELGFPTTANFRFEGADNFRDYSITSLTPLTSEP